MSAQYEIPTDCHTRGSTVLMATTMDIGLIYGCFIDQSYDLATNLFIVNFTSRALTTGALLPFTYLNLPTQNSCFENYCIFWNSYKTVLYSYNLTSSNWTTINLPFTIISMQAILSNETIVLLTGTVIYQYIFATQSFINSTLPFQSTYLTNDGNAIYFYYIPPMGSGGATNSIIIYNITQNEISVNNVSLSNVTGITYFNGDFLFLTTSESCYELNYSPVSIYRYNLDSGLHFYVEVNAEPALCSFQYPSVVGDYIYFSSSGSSAQILYYLYYNNTITSFPYISSNSEFLVLVGSNTTLLNAYSANSQIINNTIQFPQNNMLNIKFSKNYFWIENATNYQYVDMKSAVVGPIVSGNIWLIVETGVVTRIPSEFTFNLTYYVPCINSNDCNDGIYCNGIETCAEGYCIVGDLPCSNDTCQQCQEDAQDCFTPNGTICKESTFCDGVFTCNGKGTCESNGNPCINECITYCNTVLGICTASNYGEPCGTGDCNVCNGNGTCIASPVCENKISSLPRNNKMTIVFSVVGSVLLLIIIVLAILLLRKKKPKYELVPTIDDSMVEIPDVYMIEDIAIIETLASGEFGVVYKGIMDVRGFSGVFLMYF